MKKLVLTILLLTLVSSGATASTGSYRVGPSEPVKLGIYYSDSWSPTGSWQLKETALPPGAEITEVEVSWQSETLFSDQNYRGLEFILAKGDQLFRLEPPVGQQRLVTKQFKGESPGGNWQLCYQVAELNREGSYLGLLPELAIDYKY